MDVTGDAPTNTNINSPGSDPLFCASLRSPKLYHIDSICQKVGSALLWIRNISAIGKSFSAPTSDLNVFFMASHLLGWTCALIIAITMLSFRSGGWFSKNFRAMLCFSSVISLLEFKSRREISRREHTPLRRGNRIRKVESTMVVNFLSFPETQPAFRSFSPGKPL